MTEILIWGGIIRGIRNLSLGMIQKYDSPGWKLCNRDKRILAVCECIFAMLIRSVSCGDSVLGGALAILGGCLLFACITDCKTYEVYQFTWWLAGLAAVVIVLRTFGEKMSNPWLMLGNLAFFCLLQEGFFCRFYGRADCHGFVVCAVATGGMGLGLREWLNHMLLAFLGAAVIQFMCGNVNKRGNLKRPIAFLPYITGAFWINLGCFSFEKVIY